VDDSPANPPTPLQFPCKIPTAENSRRLRAVRSDTNICSITVRTGPDRLSVLIGRACGSPGPISPNSSISIAERHRWMRSSRRDQQLVDDLLLRCRRGRCHVTRHPPFTGVVRLTDLHDAIAPCECYADAGPSRPGDPRTRRPADPHTLAALCRDARANRLVWGGPCGLASERRADPRLACRPSG
jgi:hypothetical protein